MIGAWPAHRGLGARAGRGVPARLVGRSAGSAVRTAGV